MIGTIVALAILLVLGVLRSRSRLEPSSRMPRILAVLPFRALGGDDATNALGAGMTETLTAKLAQVSDRDQLQLVSTHEIETQGIQTAEQARREFGVDLVLEGSLQQAASRAAHQLQPRRCQDWSAARCTQPDRFGWRHFRPRRSSGKRSLEYPVPRNAAGETREFIEPIRH